MTIREMKRLKKEFGKDLVIKPAIRLHDDPDGDCKYHITYKNIIVGSDLVDYEFVKNYIIRKGL